ncbi:HAD domain-containing protein [Paraburkholderia xenovorans]
MILYLNFDGVLHPDQVLYADGCIPSLTAAGHRELENANILAEILGDRKGVNIVLNTWWTFYIGVDTCTDFLPTSLACRVIGSVLESAPKYCTRPMRLYEAEKLILNCPDQYVVLDHSNAVYRPDLIGNLLFTNPEEGLSNRAARRSLERRIRMLA